MFHSFTILQQSGRVATFLHFASNSLPFSLMKIYNDYANTIELNAATEEILLVYVCVCTIGTRSFKRNHRNTPKWIEFDRAS